ncbi:MAG: hypothetical protein M3O30_05470 [Planctomycetota bacterium]|nr:hypothetical protein [Planctomycetota bacterium]
MRDENLQALCEKGQEQLIAMDYLGAEETLATAEAIAWAARDYDALSRLYMPLQETRRQRRQRCGEGTIRFDILAQNQTDRIDPEQLLMQIPQGQLLIGGWNSIAPALMARQLIAQRRLFVDVLLGMVIATGVQKFIAVVPGVEKISPVSKGTPVDGQLASLPSHRVMLAESELPEPTYSSMMDIWEALHSPFLKTADAIPDELYEQKIEAYRWTIRIDYACELAHQNISDLARKVCRIRRNP